MARQIFVRKLPWRLAGRPLRPCLYFSPCGLVQSRHREDDWSRFATTWRITDNSSLRYFANIMPGPPPTCGSLSGRLPVHCEGIALSPCRRLVLRSSTVKLMRTCIVRSSSGCVMVCRSADYCRKKSICKIYPCSICRSAETCILVTLTGISRWQCSATFHSLSTGPQR
jgi:hypothetical protein